MLLNKALLALAWATTAVHATPSDGYAVVVGADDGYAVVVGADDGYANMGGPCDADNEMGGLQRFEIITAHISPGDGLARCSAPYYSGSDSCQRITPETIAAFRRYNITHIISANSQAHNQEIKNALEAAGIAYTPLPVEDFQAATQDDFRRAWEAFTRHRRTGRTLVWCGYGHGRTGMIVTALQMYAQHETGHLGTWTHEDYVRNHVERASQEEALNTLQDHLRNEPLPQPTDEERRALLAGNFAELNCVALLAALALKNSGSQRRSTMLVDAARLSRRQVTPATTTFDCERARDILRHEHVPLACKKIKNIELGVTFSNDYFSGSWDDIGATLEGPAGKATLHVATQPTRGDHYWLKVDMQASFKKDEIEIGGLDTISLNAAGIFNPPWRFGGNGQNDQWQIQDLQIRADCATPGFAAKDNKNVGLNAWYGHPGGWFREKLATKTVATFPIVPGDWAFSPPCSLIKELAYQFDLANWYWAGTFDALSFAIGEGKEIDLGENVDPDFHKAEKINLKDIFGKSEIDISDLKELKLFDNYGGGNGDQWAFEGMTFSATCAKTSKKMAMKKYQSVNKWLEHKGESQAAWTGSIKASDWLEVV
ncbi:hypothetical protein MY4824_001786 [Beauveria thailandica]